MPKVQQTVVHSGQTVGVEGPAAPLLTWGSHSLSAFQGLTMELSQLCAYCWVLMLASTGASDPDPGLEICILPSAVTDLAWPRGRGREGGQGLPKVRRL